MYLVGSTCGMYSGLRAQCRVFKPAYKDQPMRGTHISLTGYGGLGGSEARREAVRSRAECGVLVHPGHQSVS
eukprot:scaffold21736_cov174-Isochrysis_galbana.AAC.1